MKPSYGIQGGRGSFNEEALQAYLAKHGEEDFRVDYLFTTENVLSKLQAGSIDYGLFAIHNSRGGMVEESVLAMARHTFKIVEEVRIPIRHFLMKRKGVAWKEIERILTHPQVIKQCKKHLAAKRFADKVIESGTDKLIDHAAVAEALAGGKMSKYTGVIGPEILAKLYDLEIVEGDLQDEANNITSFLLVKRR